MLELCIDLKSVKYFRGSCAMRLLGLIAVLCIPQLALAQDVEPKSEPEAAKNTQKNQDVATNVVPIPTEPFNPNSRVPEIRTSDEYGVDLISGQLSYMVPIGSIGSGDQALSLTLRIESGDNNTASKSLTPDIPSLDEKDGTITIATPAFSAKFVASDGRPLFDLGQSIETLANGDRLVTHRDGTQVLFKQYTLAAPFQPTIYTAYYVPVYLLYPNGKKITYTYILRNTYVTAVGLQNNYAIQIRYYDTGGLPTWQFINKAYDSSAITSLSSDPIWPKASAVYFGVNEPLSVGSVYRTASYTNIYGQTYTPTLTYFSMSSDRSRPKYSGFLTSVQTNFDPEFFIRYRPGHTSGTAGPIAYYVDQIRKADLTVDYDNYWNFSYRGYNADIRGKRLLASGQVANEAGSTWAFGGPTPKPQFVSNAKGTTYYTYGTDFGSQGLKSFRTADGQETIFTRDARDNVTMIRTKAKPGSGIEDIVYTAAYPTSCSNRKTCNQPIYTVDERGNRTDYTYHEPSGAVLSITGPAVNGIRPETRYTYVLRNAWIASAAGGYEQVPDPVWLLASTSLCRSSAPTGNPDAPCALADDEVRTTYDYGPEAGPNNLFLRSMVVSSGGGQSLRSCYEYDKLGRQVTRTEPSANLASCY
jgi:hypothetical protein